MKKPKVSPVEAVKTSYPQLAEETHLLQQEVADLAKSISGIEPSLRRIGLNVSAWHKVAGGDHDSGYSWSRDIGYTRIGNEWFIALRNWSAQDGDEPEQTIYKFHQAPPWMCLEAAGKIPELLDELIERTRDMRTKISTKKVAVNGLAAVLADLADEAVKAREQK